MVISFIVTKYKLKFQYFDGIYEHFNYFQLIYYYCCRLECFINIVQKKTIDVTQKKNVDIYRNSQIKIPFIFFKYCEQIINDIFYILFE